MKPLLLKAITAALQAGQIAVEELTQTAKRKEQDHRKLPRAKRRKFRHDEALNCIKRDYMGITGDPSTPLLGSEFKLMFRLSKERFQVLMEDVQASGITFYKKRGNLVDCDQSSLEAQLLLPIKCLAYGVPAHTFMDYFQMSREYARECCRQFDMAIKRIYAQEYLRLPSVADVKSIVKLHRAVHKVDGLIGSLDCSHTMWKNCPKAWAGSYTGKPGSPSILLEAVVDYHMFFWHASYGYTGNIGDLNVLQQSPLLERMIDGTFHQLEEEAKVVPFDIGEEEFNKCFILVDGIYPKFSRFVKGIKEPTSVQEKKYTGWQEASRKDVERAFGVLKCTWQFLDRPILLHKLTDISLRTTCCIILHNILVADRVMGDCRETYRPSKSLLEAPQVVQQPTDLQEIQGGAAAAAAAAIGLGNAPAHLVQQVTRVDRFKELADETEHLRLHQALMNRFGN